MRIAIANRDRNSYPGGDLVQIDALARELNKINGIYTDWPLGFKPNFSGYDVVHAYHLNFSWSNIIFNNIWEQNKPYFITGIFYPQTDLGSNAEQMREYVNRSLFTAVQSNLEASELLKITNCDDSKIRVIPNGVEREFVCDSNTHTRQGVITVSARDGDKNTNLVETICYNLCIPYSNISKVDRSTMPLVYKLAKVFINASSSERMSLTTHEALASMCRVVDTKYNRGNEWYPGIITCDPNDPDSLSKKISYAYYSTNWDYLPNTYAQELTWESAAKEYIKCIQELP